MRGHIRKRGDRSWSIVIDLERGLDGKRRQKWIADKGSKRDAERRLAEVLSARQTGTLADLGRLTVADWLAEWLANRQGQIAQSTADWYRSALDTYIVPHPGHHQTRHLQPALIQRWANELLRSGLAPRTVHATLAALRTALGAACTAGHDDPQPRRHVSSPRVESRTPSPLTVETAVTLLDGAQDTPLYEPVLLAITLSLNSWTLSRLYNINI